MRIMQELLITRESVSGHSWTSKVFNTVISLDTYQFLRIENLSWLNQDLPVLQNKNKAGEQQL